ncbi:class II aldolase/adducin family protein [Chromobacterium piscinae]|uniref:class II aldolase/adducin family protein n=1 Tax=Chromobacterium piscinae TaxID=686831 RepID=UPI001E4F3DF9|nr:class II aldolase/adducin family protein [Chromobacterium piscinae]MCD5327527.1 class II aldolase/adducin family protein [Chromobacterium piscinae]
MFDYRRPLRREEVFVTLVDNTPDNGTLADAIARAGVIFGFKFVPEEELPSSAPKGVLIQHMIWRCNGPYQVNLVQAAATALERFTTISLAFSYRDEMEMLGFEDAVEQSKSAYKGRINFIRPDEKSAAGRLCVSVHKLVENAVCDSVRVKYRARCLSVEPVLDGSTSDARDFFLSASEVYRRHHLYLRAPSDGYFAIRTNDGFLITATKTNKANLDLRRVSKVTHFDPDRNEITYSGEFLPSSDAVEAAVIFASCPAVSCLLHTHASRLFTRNPRYRDHVTVPVLPYGDQRLGHAVSQSIRDQGRSFVIMEEHGEVFSDEGRGWPSLLTVIDDYSRRAAADL